MSVRTIVSIASILGLLVTAAAAQQAETAAAASASSALTNPPVFQGLMVDAKGKTVGRFYPAFMPYLGGATVVRQISGIWVSLNVVDLSSGFFVASPPGALPPYYFQSIDCTGQAWMVLSSVQPTAAMAPVPSFVTAIPPVTAPSIYFAGTPTSVLTMQSTNQGENFNCYHFPGGGQSLYVGPARNVPVSSLGLTLPFSIK
jgi:hypothetical protein